MKKTSALVAACCSSSWGAARRPGHRRRSPSPSKSASAWLSPKTRSTWRRRRGRTRPRPECDRRRRSFSVVDRPRPPEPGRKSVCPRVPSFVPGGRPQRVAIDFTKDYQFSLNFTLPLYTGGRLTSGYRTARLNYLSSQESSRQTTNETVFNVKRGYYNYLLAKQLVGVTEEALNLAEKTYRTSRTCLRSGWPRGSTCSGPRSGWPT